MGDTSELMLEGVLTFFRALARLFSLRRWSLTTAAGYIGLGYCAGVSVARWIS